MRFTVNCGDAARRLLHVVWKIKGLEAYWNWQSVFERGDVTARLDWGGLEVAGTWAGYSIPGCGFRDGRLLPWNAMLV